MFRSISHHWKPLLIFMSVAIAAALSVAALPDDNEVDGETGRWIPTSNTECENPALICVVWEFSGGGTSPPCCITPDDLLASSPTCTSTNFRG